jgi:phage shock protein A
MKIAYIIATVILTWTTALRADEFELQLKIAEIESKQRQLEAEARYAETIRRCEENISRSRASERELQQLFKRELPH